ARTPRLPAERGRRGPCRRGRSPRARGTVRCGREAVRALPRRARRLPPTGSRRAASRRPRRRRAARGDARRGSGRSSRARRACAPVPPARARERARSAPAATRSAPTSELGLHVDARELPVARDRRRRDVEDLRDLPDLETGEEAQLDDAGGARRLLLEPCERAIEVEEIDLRGGERRRGGESDGGARFLVLPLLASTAPGAVDQH